MLWTRLYHPNWPNVLAGSALGGLLMFLPAAAALAAALTANWAAAGVLAAVGLGYLLGQLALLMLLETAIGGMLRRRGEATMKLDPLLLLRLLLAIPATQLLYAAAICDCLLTRELTWRGIRYVIKGPWDALMTGHAPYAARDQHTNVSLH
jgi:hypothetical protein